jgi:hypothetical protein
MTTKSLRNTKTFTVDQANAMLPLVRAITSDLVNMYRDVVERRQRLKRLFGGRDPDSKDPYTDELVQIQEELAKDVQKLEGFMDELRELRVELKSPADGLIDFPSLLDGQPVYLCWQLGEPEVLHWHPIDEGFSARQPLPAAVGAGGSIGIDY